MSPICLQLCNAHRRFKPLHVFAVGFFVFEKVAVAIIRHVDRSVTHDCLDAFRLPTEMGNEQAGSGVAQHVEVIIDAALFDQRIPAVVVEVLHCQRLSVPRREYKIEVALRATQPPYPQRVGDNRGEGNIGLAGFRFRRSHFAPGIGTLPDMDYAGFKIDISPAQATQFAQTHPGEDSRNDKGPHPAARVVDERVDLGHGREIDAGAQRPLGDLPFVPFYFDASCYVLRNKPASLRKGEHGSDIGHNFLPHNLRATGFAQLPVECVEAGSVQVGELDAANEGIDVMFKVLLPLIDGAPLKAARRALVKPQAPSLCDGPACAGSRMRALPYFVLGLIEPRIRDDAPPAGRGSPRSMRCVFRRSSSSTLVLSLSPLLPPFMAALLRDFDRPCAFAD